MTRVRPPWPERSRRRRWIALAIFGVAFGVRLLHLYQMAAAPFFTLLLGDSRAYDAWAQRLAAGDWIGTDVFYQAPLYPYFLGVLYRIAGRQLEVVRIVQAAIGSASCVLLAIACRRLYGGIAGVAAGCLLALWAPAIFFDSLLQKSVFDVFFVCVIVWLIAQVRLKPDLRWLALGLAVGALALTRENAIVFALVLIGWALLTPPRARHAAWLVAGAALVLAPVAIRNYAVGGGLYLTTSQFGPNFYIGNNARADGTYASLRYGRGAPEFERQDATEIAERALARHLSPAEVSSYWTDRALGFVTDQPLAWARLMARKFALLWNATEMVDTESQESYAEWSWPLRVLGPITHFGVLVPLAVRGVILAPPRRAAERVIAALTVASAASVLLFYVFGRYRYPLVPLLIVPAAAAIAAFAGLIRTRWTWTMPASRVAAVAAALLAIAVFCNWRLVPHAWMRAVSETNLGVALQAEHRYDEALDRYQRALALRPDYAPAINNLATAYRAAGQVDRAVDTYRRALALQPDFPDAEYNLANALLEKGATGEAIDRFEAALRSMPDSADVHNNLGTALAANGRTREAIDEFTRALALDPASAVAHRNLGNLLSEAGDQAGALDHLRRAVEADPSSGEAQYDFGSALLEAQRFDEAIPHLRAAAERQPASAEARNNLGIALASAGQMEAAIAQFRDALRLNPGLADARRNLELATKPQRAR